MSTDILLTIDTEVYPLESNWQKDCLKADIGRDIYGRTPLGDWGLAYQLELLRRHNLSAVFFVEGLFAGCSAVGLGPLRQIVDLIYSYGQDIQLHLHPEWIPYLSNCPLSFRGDLLTCYSENEQLRLIEMAGNNLQKAGARAPVAFRAGDYAANEGTLNALSRLGFRFDSSFDYPYLRSTCGLSSLGPTWHASPAHGLWEVPVSCFADWPGHYRHCQLGACSTGELSHAIHSAVAAGWNVLTLVSHSFELITNRRSSRPVVARPLAIRRFEELCRLLVACEPDAKTTHFGDLTLTQREVGPIYGSVIRTARRFLEQLESHVHARFA
jgi:hypothetical protein